MPSRRGARAGQCPLSSQVPTSITCAVMSTASKAAGRKRLAAVASFLLVAGVIAATMGRVADEPQRVAGEFILVVVAIGGAWVALTTTKARRATAGSCHWSRSWP